MGDVAINHLIHQTSGPRLEAQKDVQTLDSARARALDRADRREWSQKKFVVGGETRWQETLSDETPRYGRRRFVYDPKTDRVVEID